MSAELAALASASRLLDAADRLGDALDDDTPPRGIRRPQRLDLAEADPITQMCAEARALIRADVAAAMATVQAWEPGRR